MCELHVRVKLYKAACSMSDANSHFFINTGIRVRAVCLLSVPLHKNI